MKTNQSKKIQPRIEDGKLVMSEEDLIRLAALVSEMSGMDWVKPDDRNFLAMASQMMTNQVFLNLNTPKLPLNDKPL